MAAPILLIRRDIAILTMVHAFGGCTADQVAKRLFPSLRGPRMCYRRIAGLAHDGHLEALRLPATNGVGSGKNFLTLTPRGRAIVAAGQGFAVKELPRTRANSPRFIEHHLAIGDTRIAFELAAERSTTVKLNDWLVDRATVIESTDQGRDHIVLVPDGAFTMTDSSGPAVQALLEQDTGTLTNRSRMRTRLLGYLRHTQTARVLVLFVTTTTERLNALASLTSETGKAASLDARVVWFATCEAIASGDPLNDRIWHLPGNRTLVAIADVFGTFQRPKEVSGGPVE